MKFCSLILVSVSYFCAFFLPLIEAVAQTNDRRLPYTTQPNNGVVPNNGTYNQVPPNQAPFNNNSPSGYGNYPLQNAPGYRPGNSNFPNTISGQIIRAPARRNFRLYVEPLGVTLNPLSVGPSLTVGGTLSYFVASTYSIDILAVVPIFAGSDAYTKSLYGAGLGKTFANGAVIRFGVGYKSTTELRKYDRVVDKQTEAALPVGEKSDFSNCPNVGLEDLSTGRQTVTYVNCNVTIAAQYFGVYASVGMQMIENENFGVHLRLFTLFYPIPLIEQKPVYDVRDPREKGVLTPRDTFDVSSLGMSLTFAH